MTDEDAFLRAICEAPEDDSPRLVYCDWLEDRGDEDAALRAEFIRVQIELANGADWRLQLGCRSGLLLTRHGDEWGGRDLAHTDDRKEFERANHPVAWWDRGFVGSIRLPTAAFLRHAGAVFSRHPVVSVRLTDRSPYRPLSDIADGVWFRGLDGDGTHPQSDLPIELFDLLSGGSLAGPIGDLSRMCRDYSVRRLAHEDLSSACYLFGRSLAGLGPLREAVAV